MRIGTVSRGRSRRRRWWRSSSLVAPLYLSAYWVGTLLTQMLFLGIVAASLIFLSAYGGMVSLAQVVDVRDRRVRRRERDDERQHEGAQPRLEPLVGRARRAS